MEITSLKKINLKDVVYWAATVWDRIKSSTLQKSWSKTMCNTKDVEPEEPNQDSGGSDNTSLQNSTFCLLPQI
jgi:hypothetical protein